MPLAPGEALVNGGDPPMPMVEDRGDVEIPEFSTEDSELPEAFPWSAYVFSDEDEPIEEPKSPAASSVPCIQIEDSPGLAAEKALLPSDVSRDMNRAEFDDYKKFLCMVKTKLASMTHGSEEPHLSLGLSSFLLFLWFYCYVLLCVVFVLFFVALCWGVWELV